MATIPKRVVERYKKTVSKFQQVLRVARDRDVNEADTVSIIQDMLAEVFGFQKYTEITSEYAIRNTYCDLAIKMDEKIQYLIEVKAIGLTLKESHLKQTIDYGANHGVQWVVLTNGIAWVLYKIRFERPIGYDLVASFDFPDLNPRKAEDQEIGKAAREDYYERIQSVNRFVVAALVLSKPVVSCIRRDVRRLASGLKVEGDEIEKILRYEVFKRDVIEGDEADKAMARVQKILAKGSRRPRKTKSGRASVADRVKD